MILLHTGIRYAFVNYCLTRLSMGLRRAMMVRGSSSLHDDRVWINCTTHVTKIVLNRLQDIPFRELCESIDLFFFHLHFFFLITPKIVSIFVQTTAVLVDYVSVSPLRSSVVRQSNYCSERQNNENINLYWIMNKPSNGVTAKRTSGRDVGWRKLQYKKYWTISIIYEVQNKHTALYWRSEIVKVINFKRI